MLLDLIFSSAICRVFSDAPRLNPSPQHVTDYSHGENRNEHYYRSRKRHRSETKDGNLSAETEDKALCTVPATEPRRKVLKPSVGRRSLQEKPPADTRKEEPWEVVEESPYHCHRQVILTARKSV